MTGDPKQLWQEQPKEGPDMGLDLVRKRIAEHRARVRRSRWALGATAFAGVLLAAEVAYRVHEPVIRVGEALLAAGFVVLLLRGWPRDVVAAPDDGASECAAYLRDRLIEQRRRHEGGWLLVAPLAPGMLVLLAGLLALAGDAWMPKLGPILLLLLIWGGAMLIIGRRERTRVAAEIAELDRLRFS